MYVAGLIDWRTTGSQKSNNSNTPSQIENNALRAFQCAHELITTSKAWNERNSNSHLLQVPLIRVGFSCSTIFGGIISRFKFAYDIFGSAMDIAETLASVGTPLSLSLCESTLQEVRDDIKGFVYRNSGVLVDSLVKNEVTVGSDNVKYITIQF